MTNIISIAFAVLTAYLIYQCFEKYGFWQAYGVSVVLSMVQSIINNGFKGIFLSLIGTLVVCLATTGINLWVYKRTHSFITFFIVSIIVEIVIIFLIVTIPSLLISGTMASAGLLAH